MVRDFFKGGGHSEQKIAQLTGILAASQSFFRSLSAYGLGIVMDKLGRKVGRFCPHGSSEGWESLNYP